MGCSNFLAKNVTPNLLIKPPIHIPCMRLLDVAYNIQPCLPHMLNIRLRLFNFIATKTKLINSTQEKIRDMTNVAQRFLSMWRMSVGMVGGLLRNKKIKIEHVMISS